MGNLTKNGIPIINQQIDVNNNSSRRIANGNATKQVETEQMDFNNLNNFSNLMSSNNSNSNVSNSSNVSSNNNVVSNNNVSNNSSTNNTNYAVGSLAWRRSDEGRAARKELIRTISNQRNVNNEEQRSKTLVEGNNTESNGFENNGSSSNSNIQWTTTNEDNGTGSNISWTTTNDKTVTSNINNNNYPSKDYNSTGSNNGSNYPSKDYNITGSNNGSGSSDPGITWSTTNEEVKTVHSEIASKSPFTSFSKLTNRIASDEYRSSNPNNYNQNMANSNKNTYDD